MRWAPVLLLLCGGCELGESYYLEPTVWATHGVYDGSTGAHVEGDAINAGVTLRRYRTSTTVDIDGLDTMLAMLRPGGAPVVVTPASAPAAPKPEGLSDQIRATGDAARDMGPWGALAIIGCAAAGFAVYLLRSRRRESEARKSK